jgi:thiamine-phosphate pyrophosphorylase
VICDAEVCARAGWTLRDLASACLDGGARFLQLRAKQMGGNAFLEHASAIVGRAAQAGAVVLINDRADVARLSGAAGVHVGQEDLTPRQVRTIVGGDAIVGLSTHDSAQCETGLEQPVSYLAVGPIFGTATKATGYDPVGLAAVRRAADQIASSRLPAMPLVAIGGISLETAPSVIRAGAQAVAVISDLLKSGNPAERVTQFLRALDESPLK